MGFVRKTTGIDLTGGGQEDAAREAAKIQKQAGEDAIGAQQDALASFEERTDPFRAAGLTALNPLLQLFGIDPGTAQGFLNEEQQSSNISEIQSRLDEAQEKLSQAGGGGFFGSAFKQKYEDDVAAIQQELADAQAQTTQKGPTSRLLSNAPGSDGQVFGSQQYSPQQFFTDPSISLQQLQGVAQQAPAVSLQEILQLAQQQPSTTLDEIGGIMRGEMTANPLVQQAQDEAARRLMANKAAGGKIGSGQTLEDLSRSLSDISLDEQQRQIVNLMRLRQQELGERQTGIANLFGVRGDDITERQQQLSNLMGLRGTERQDQQLRFDEQQTQAANLFDLLRLGSNVATGQGTHGMSSAVNVGNIMQGIGNVKATVPMVGANVAGQQGNMLMQALGSGISGGLGGIGGAGFGSGFMSGLGGFFGG